jgi:hypothetical protein
LLKSVRGDGVLCVCVCACVVLYCDVLTLSFSPVSLTQVITELGSTYCAEEHGGDGGTVAKMTKGGRITKAAFVKWYVDWLLSDDVESD